MPPVIAILQDMWAFAWRGLVATYAVAGVCWLLAHFVLRINGW